MIRLFAAILALTLTLCMQPARSQYLPEDFSDPVLQARYEKLIHELRCMQCQNNTIADSPAGLASDLRHEVHDLVASGKTEAQILDYLTSRYGDFIRYRPPLAPRTFLLWFGPLLFLLIGGVAAWRIIAQRSRLAGAETNNTEEEPQR